MEVIMGRFIKKKKLPDIHNAFLRLKYDNADCLTEGDVEHKIIIPILEKIFNIPNVNIKAKNYVPSFNIGKGSKFQSGYFPDFTVFVNTLPVVVVEAKSPDKPIELAIEEAKLYALELNKKYKSGVNPAKYIIASNGVQFAFGIWDNDSDIIMDINNVIPNASDINKVYNFINFDALDSYSKDCLERNSPSEKYYSAMNIRGGIRRAMIPVEPNPFFGTGILSRLIDLYFDNDESNIDEIIDKAYVSTSDRNDFDRELEAMLKSRLCLLENKYNLLNSNSSKDCELNNEIKRHISSFHNTSKMQLIIGAVGSGKSLFIKRFYTKLLDEEIRKNSIWAFINFNVGYETKEILEDWVAKQFIEEIEKNAAIQGINILDEIENVFATEINRRRVQYNMLKGISEEKYKERLANDLLEWQNDKKMYLTCLSRYLSGEKGITIIVVFDNVDRQDSEVQLKIFQVAKWLLDETKSLGLMDLRDTTYETYKSQPPLDAFVNSSNFYITPPYLQRIISRRLILAAQKIKEECDGDLEAILHSGAIVKYSPDKLQDYFTSIFKLISKDNGKRLLGALSNNNIRAVLNVFSQILKSGHVDAEKFISSDYSNECTNNEIKVAENELIRAIMRGSYKYYTEKSIITNIYGSLNNAKKHNSFLILQCLLFLNKNFSNQGDKLLKGFFYCNTVIDKLEKYGFLHDDIMNTLKYLLKNKMIFSERCEAENLQDDDLIQIAPSGFLHLTFLSKRLEYVSSCAYCSRIRDKDVAERIGELWEISKDNKDIKKIRKKEVVSLLIDSIEKEFNDLKSSNPFFDADSEWILEIINNAKEAIHWEPYNTTDAQSLLPLN